VTLSVGALVIAVGYGSSLALMGTTVGLLVVTLICNTGVGLAYGAMPALIMGAVPQEETASANSFNTLMRSIGTSVSAAVIGVVLAQMTTTLGGHALPSENGFRVAMLIGCGVGLVAAVVAAFIPSRHAAAPLGDPADTEPGAAPRAATEAAA
ncbi:MFS transporter, partial [Streptomyces sp. NPDC057674]